MGRQWICALGLGNFHKYSNAFHCFCREQDVEGRVKAGVANGFELQREEEGFAALHPSAIYRCFSLSRQLGRSDFHTKVFRGD